MLAVCKRTRHHFDRNWWCARSLRYILHWKYSMERISSKKIHICFIFSENVRSAFDHLAYGYSQPIAHHFYFHPSVSIWFFIKAFYILTFQLVHAHFVWLPVAMCLHECSQKRTQFVLLKSVCNRLCWVKWDTREHIEVCKFFQRNKL